MSKPRMKNARKVADVAKQDDRNKRLKKPTKAERDILQSAGRSEFACDGCNRIVVIKWSTLRGDERPMCRVCNTPLRVRTAMLNAGVLPKSE
jgi:hypothetical protein